MDKEVSAILETVNEALKGLPPIASDAFEVLIKGTRVSGIIGLIECLVFLFICYMVFKFLFKLHKDPVIYDTSGDMQGKFVAFFWVVGLVFGTITVMALFSIAGNIMDIIMPEYSLIKSILSTIMY